MKKVISLLLAGIISILPLSAYAAEEKTISVEDVLNEDYDYRWTVKAELDDTYKNTWLDSLADDGKLEITFAETNENLFDSNNNERSARWVIAFKGNQGEYVSPLSSESEYANVQRKYIEDNGKNFNLYMYGHGCIVMDIGEYPTVIYVGHEELTKAEDTSVNLCERNEIYNYKGLKGFSYGDYAFTRKLYMQEHGIEGDLYLIEAKAVIRDNMKKPVLSDEEYLKALGSTSTSLNFEKPVEELIHSEENKWLRDHADDDSYAAIILSGTYGDYYYRAFEEGKMSFNLSLPVEYVSNISTDGKVSFELQRYVNFEINKAFPGNFYEYDYGDKNGRKEYEYYKLVTLSGNLGQAQYLADTENGYFKGEADYAEFALYPVTESDDTVIAAKKTDENSNSLKAPIELYIEFTKGKSFCGIEKVGMKAGGENFSIPADEAVIDFDAEVSLSARYVGSAAGYLVRTMREERSVNNSTESSLSTGNKEEPIEKPIKVYAENTEIKFSDCEPIIKNGRVLVPMRAIFETLGATVEWNKETRTVTAKKGDTIITLQRGQKEIVKNGEAVGIDTEAQIMNDRTLVPLRAVSTSLDYKVQWNEKDRSVTIE